MTVGLAAACCVDEHEPKVVIAADRMVTSGRLTKIEYEHTQTKIEVLYEEDAGVNCMSVCSGDTSLSDDFHERVTSKLDGEQPHGVEQIVQMGIDAYQDMIQTAVNRQVLGPVGITIDELTSEDVDLDSGTVQALLSDVLEKKEEIQRNLTVMIAGVDGTGYTIASIPDGDVVRHDSIGYHAIGSGGQPARTSFIRSEYDTSCAIEMGLLRAVEAKTHAEPAQGVGEKMDVAVISARGCEQLGENDLGELIDYYEEIVEEEDEARKRVIENAEYSFD